MVDIAEVKLMEALKNNQNWAVAFTLRTLGKDRQEDPHFRRGTLQFHQPSRFSP